MELLATTEVLAELSTAADFYHLLSCCHHQSRSTFSFWPLTSVVTKCSIVLSDCVVSQREKIVDVCIRDMLVPMDVKDFLQTLDVECLQ